MPGMQQGFSANNPTVVAAFEAALHHQLLIVLGILLVVMGAWVFLRTVQLHRVAAGAQGPPGDASLPEPAGRRLVRVAFGLLWLLDGILQAQPAMPLGFPSRVIEPAASTSPAWVQHIVSWGAGVWAYHPVTAAASVVWIQAGLGIWLLISGSGRWSQLGGLASAGWGLIVWVFGESFGGIFAPGLTWMFGAPGAALFYAVAGLLLALPLRAWSSPRLGRALLASIGFFLAGMGVLQAWPGRGFWRNAGGGHPGTLAAMVRSMGSTEQPQPFAAAAAWFARVVASGAFWVNLSVTILLIVTGATLAAVVARREPPGTTWRRVMLGVLISFGLAALADWVLVQDLGFFGGVGTDPNSMLPMIAIVAAGYLAFTRVPAPVPVRLRETAADTGGTSANAASRPWWVRTRPATLVRGVASAGAVGVVLIGATPMALASASGTASTILATSIDGAPQAEDFRAPPFDLVDQRGRAVSLASLRGRTVVLTFLDPVCTLDCPLIAQELRIVDQMLGQQASSVELVAVVANPVYRSTLDLQAFDRQEGMDALGNWLYLTGSGAALRKVWASYGVLAAISPAGAMIDHNDLLYVIDRTGTERYVMSSDPGPGDPATRSSFASLVTGAVRDVMSSP